MSNQEKVEAYNIKLLKFMDKVAYFIQNPSYLTQDAGIDMLAAVDSLLSDNAELPPTRDFAYQKVQLEAVKRKLTMAMVSTPGTKQYDTELHTSE